MRGVDKVFLHPKGSKKAQRNDGNHYQPHNFIVHSKLFPGRDMEFELSRHEHFKDQTKPFTITAMFRETAEDLFLEAWRILAEVCKGKELLPIWVAQQHEKARLRHSACEVFHSSDDVSEDVLIDSSDEELIGAKDSSAQPGSASLTPNQFPRLRLETACTSVTSCSAPHSASIEYALEKFREKEETNENEVDWT